MMMYSISYFCTKMHHFKAKIPTIFPTPLVAFDHLFVPLILNPFPQLKLLTGFMSVSPSAQLLVVVCLSVCVMTLAVWLSGWDISLLPADFPFPVSNLWFTADHFVGKLFAVGQPTRPTQFFIPPTLVNE